MCLIHLILTQRNVFFVVGSYFLYCEWPRAKRTFRWNCDLSSAKKNCEMRPFVHSSTWVLGSRSVELRTTFSVCVWSVKYEHLPRVNEHLSFSKSTCLQCVWVYNVHICALSYVVWIFNELRLNKLNRFFRIYAQKMSMDKSLPHTDARILSLVTLHTQDSLTHFRSIRKIFDPCSHEQ